MTLTTHATVGIVIGTATGNPVVGFILGILSHYVLDFIPHGDHFLSDGFRKTKNKVKSAVAYGTLDAIAGILLILYLVNWKDLSNLEAISWSVAGAVLPDLLVGITDLFKFKILAPLNRFHFWIHDYVVTKKGDVPLKFSLLGQIIFIFILIQFL